MYKYLLLSCTALFMACSGKKTEVVKESKPAVIYEGNLIQPLYLGEIMESPNRFGPVWNLELCRKIKFQKISMYVKGGYLPNNMSEKLTYTFDSEGNPKDFSHYLYNVSVNPFSNSSFVYAEDGKLAKIDISKYLDFSNLPPVLIKNDSTQTLSVTSRGDGKSDSLIFYPSAENPKVILEIVNDFYNTVEIIAQKGTAANDLKMIIAEIDSNLVNFELTEKMVTFMENGLPVESYHLDKNWNKQEKSKIWTYNSNNQPVKYKEWLHGTLVKDIVINYNDNNLPSEIIVDRKKYIFYTLLQ